MEDQQGLLLVRLRAAGRRRLDQEGAKPKVDGRGRGDETRTWRGGAARGGKVDLETGIKPHARRSVVSGARGCSLESRLGLRAAPGSRSRPRGSGPSDLGTPSRTVGINISLFRRTTNVRVCVLRHYTRPHEFRPENKLNNKIVLRFSLRYKAQSPGAPPCALENLSSQAYGSHCGGAS